MGYFSDYLGSPLLLSNQNGEVLRYAERGAWGELKLPVYENLNYAGVENSLCYTNYNYDPRIDKYFAKARVYEVKQGRMLAKDPVKRGVNGYPYCKNNPINNVDPTGEIANVLVAGGLGVLGGGIVNFAGSIISQKLNGETVNLRKAAGAAANGEISTPSGFGASGGIAPTSKRKDPKAGCGGRNPFQGGNQYQKTYGYQKEAPRTQRKGFDFLDFCGEVAFGGLMGGITNTAIYGGTKWVESLRGGVKGGTSAEYYNTDGSPIWPRNREFKGKPTIKTLRPGTLVDRYGYDGGTFVSPKGTSYTK